MITNPEIDAYILNLLPPRDEVLSEMEAYAAANGVPIIGPAVARVLAQLAMISRSKRIFELGSAIGYSTIWLARAAGEDGEIHYSDGSEENARRARSYFERAGVSDRIQIHTGDALQELASVKGEFDLIFNDVDKDGYPDVLKAVPNRLKKGGIFVTDNTLWHGKVLAPQDKESLAVVDFDKKLFESIDFWSSIIPIRDGLTVSIRI